MMMKKVLLLPLLLLLCGCVQETSLKQQQLAGTLEEFVLQNGVISCSFLPEASGLFSRMEYLPEKRELISSPAVSAFHDDLLPSRIKTSATGSRELLWGAALFHNLPCAVTGTEKKDSTVRLFMEQDFFGGYQLRARKEIRLSAGCSFIRNRFTLSSTAEKPEIITLWNNLITSLGKKDIDPVLMPVKGGIRSVIDRGGWSVRQKSIMSFGRDGVFVEDNPGLMNVYTAPGRPWIARFTRECPGVLVMRTTPEALSVNAQFYSYKRGNARTMEMIFSPVTLAPGKSHTWVIDYIFFPSLKCIRDAAGNYGIDRRDEAGATILELESCAPVPGGKITLDSGEQFSLPPMRPGKLQQIRIPKQAPGKAVAGTLPDGTRFQLNGLLQ